MALARCFHTLYWLATPLFIAVIGGLALLIPPAYLLAQPGNGNSEGTFAKVSATSGSNSAPFGGGSEPVIKPNADIQMQLSPGGSYTTTTDAGGNFSFNEINVAEKGANTVTARLTIPICTWRFRYPNSGPGLGRNTQRERERECARWQTNQVMLRWREDSSDAMASGRIAPSGTATVNVPSGGSRSDMGLPVRQRGANAGDFDVPPVVGDFLKGDGSFSTTIINTACTGQATGASWQQPIKRRPCTSTGRFDRLRLMNLPPYTITMTVETRNLEDPETGLDKNHQKSINQKAAQTWVAGLKRMTAQFTSTIYHRAAIVGSFFDAWGQQDAQRTLQRMQAEAVKDYAPGKALCRFGSLSSSQAGTDMKMQANQLALDAYMQGRELGKEGRNAGIFAFRAGQSRLRQFKRLHCFKQQNSRNGLEEVCSTIAPTARDYSDTPSQRYNRDIDYTRLLATKNTLNFDMTDNQLTADEEDVMALSRRLYAHETFSKLDGEAIGGPRQNYYQYMKVRSINAARSVARSAFTDYVAKKAKGSGTAAGPHMRALVRELGLSQDKAEQYIGTNPSYHAQMDVLNKKIYQDPGFVANLYDTPTNVTRQHVLMYARKLIQRREIYKTLKRREMMLASLLEMRLREVQGQVNARLPVVGQSFQSPEDDD
jgi:hypothetical protein